MTICHGIPWYRNGADDHCPFIIEGWWLFFYPLSYLTLTVHLSKGQKLNRLKELSKMYALYAPIQATYKESQSLKGFAKMKYDREHKDSLSKYPELKERMQSLLQNGEKITPKQWKAEIQSLQSEYDNVSKEQTKTATELAYAEIISYNKKNLERELQNESRQHNRQQNKTRRREEEI